MAISAAIAFVFNNHLKKQAKKRELVTEYLISSFN
jgi:hypothetical protein